MAPFWIFQYGPCGDCCFYFAPLQFPYGIPRCNTQMVRRAFLPGPDACQNDLLITAPVFYQHGGYLSRFRESVSLLSYLVPNQIKYFFRQGKVPDMVHTFPAQE